MSPLNCFCAICKSPMLWQNRCGRESCCCSKECRSEFYWRLKLSILDKPYRPRSEAREVNP